jgi:hypothetical protein
MEGGNSTNLMMVLCVSIDKFANLKLQYSIAIKFLIYLNFVIMRESSNCDI